MFTVPESSSPPATPDKRNPFALPDPSTTPAGPPPTSFTAASTTPAGLPPSSVFGSVQNNRPIPFPSAASFARKGFSTNSTHTFQASIEDDYDDGEEEDGYDAMDEDQFLGSSTRSVEDIIPSIEGPNFSAIAKALVGTSAPLTEPSDVILATDTVVEDISKFIKTGLATGDDIDAALCIAVEELLKLWRTGQVAPRQHLGIGPENNASPHTKAVFLSSLLLEFHHPSRRAPPPGSFRSSRNNNISKTVPEALLDWLKEYHNQYPHEFAEVLETQPNVCAHSRFWDIVLSLTVLGNIAGASRLLREADFRMAASAQDEDQSSEPGYRGKQLGNIQRVVNRAIAVLDSCPAVQSGDWNVTGNDWAIFRKRVKQAFADLESFAEGSSLDRAGEDKAFEAENFGLSSIADDEFSLSTMSRRAESKVPWYIYQSLLSLYGQLLGARREIVAASADWVEATICSTVWWDGEDDEGANTNLNSSRRSLARSQGPRQVDLLPRTAYQQRLSLSFSQITAENQESELQVNTANPIEVGVACIFDGDLQGVLQIVRGWSSTISTAIVEIANTGSWLNIASDPSRSLMDRFDQSDLLVLSFAQQSDRRINRDEMLLSYADQVNRRGTLYSSQKGISTEGWELAVQIMSRLGNTTLSNTRIENLLGEVDLTAKGQIEKVVGVCETLSLPEIGRNMAEKYSDHLAATSQDYGGALYYYARAHKVQRIKDVVNVLVTSCLVQSIAYPPHKDMDSTLASIVDAPKQTLARLATLDREAAEMLSAHVSGYAMVRRFYELRDQEVGLKSGSKAALRPLARRKEAATTLIAIIESAADSIHGGLYDASVHSAIQVDGLLVLLGEALMFFNQQKQILTTPQIFALMQAAEDVSTVSSSIYSQAEECLKSALAHGYGSGALPSPRGMLARSDPSLSASSSFSMIGSGLSMSGYSNKAKTLERGWDWRTGLKRDASGEDVLKILRLQLAKEAARVWTEEHT